MRADDVPDVQHTVSIPLKQEMSSRDIRTLYQDRYAGERLVKVSGEPPSVKAISGKHGVVRAALFCLSVGFWHTSRHGLICEQQEIGGFAVHSSGKRVVVCATIDNLLKGAATQALR